MLKLPPSQVDSAPLTRVLFKQTLISASSMVNTTTFVYSYCDIWYIDYVLKRKMVLSIWENKEGQWKRDYQFETERVIFSLFWDQFFCSGMEQICSLLMFIQFCTAGGWISQSGRFNNSWPARENRGSNFAIRFLKTFLA